MMKYKEQQASRRCPANRALASWRVNKGTDMDKERKFRVDGGIPMFVIPVFLTEPGFPYSLAL